MQKLQYFPLTILIVADVDEMVIVPVLSIVNVRQLEFAYRNPNPKNLISAGLNPTGRTPIVSPFPDSIVSAFEKLPVATISTIFPYLA